MITTTSIHPSSSGVGTIYGGQTIDTDTCVRGVTKGLPIEGMIDYDFSQTKKIMKIAAKSF